MQLETYLSGLLFVIIASVASYILYPQWLRVRGFFEPIPPGTQPNEVVSDQAKMKLLLDNLSKSTTSHISLWIRDRV